MCQREIGTDSRINDTDDTNQTAFWVKKGVSCAKNSHKAERTRYICAPFCSTIMNKKRMTENWKIKEHLSERNRWANDIELLESGCCKRNLPRLYREGITALKCNEASIFFIASLQSLRRLTLKSNEAKCIKFMLRHLTSVYFLLERLISDCK